MNHLDAIESQGLKGTTCRLARTTSAVVFSVCLLWSLSGTASAARIHHQSTGTVDAETGETLAGGAILTRTANKVELSVHPTDLDPSSAYTIWWVVFNDPKHCIATECGADDLGNPKVKASIFYATGFVSSGDGNANAYATLNAGRIPAGAEVLTDNGVRAGLRRDKGLSAEIHAIIRSHGAFDPTRAAAQIGESERFEPGC